MSHSSAFHAVGMRSKHRGVHRGVYVAVILLQAVLFIYVCYMFVRGINTPVNSQHLSNGPFRLSANLRLGPGSPSDAKHIVEQRSQPAYGQAGTRQDPIKESAATISSEPVDALQR